MPSREKSTPAAAQVHNAPPEDELDDLPPAYSMPIPSPEARERQADLGRTIPGLPNLNFASYMPPSASATRDLVTITITDSTLCKSPQALAKVLSEQIALPPVPEIRIRGEHKGWSEDAIDFDLRVNMMRYFIPPNGENGLTYTKLISGGGKRKEPLLEGGATAVEQWAQAFCGDPATEKCFCITRKLSNWDSDYIVGRILALAASINYKGNIEVTFPVHHQRVLIKPSQSFGSVLRSAFLAGGRYEVEAHWPYASHMPSDDSDSSNRAVRTCLVRSEAGWFKDWKPVLRSAMLSKRKGWIGLEDWMETAMSPPADERPPQPWGASR